MLLVQFLQSLGLPYEVAWTVSQAAMILALSVSLLVMLAFLLLFDRKVWAAVQMRRGPNVVGAFGLLQSFADFIKFVLKEVVIPAGANKGVFLLAPLLAFTLSMAAWAVVPVGAANGGAGSSVGSATDSLEAKPPFCRRTPRPTITPVRKTTTAATVAAMKRNTSGLP